MIRPYKKNGFTIIELTLAMTFLSILLIMITMMVIKVSNIYTKGLTLKDVNQAGRVITRDLQQTILQDRSFNTSTNFIINKDSSGREYGGRLCTGQYSYIWNYGKRLVDGITASSDNSNLGYPNPLAPNDNLSMMRLIRVSDTTAQYCSDPNSKVDTSSAYNLLGVDDLELALYDFSIKQVAFDSKTGQALYYVSFIVGTESAAAANQDSCTPNSGLDDNYCSVSQFNLAVRSSSEIQY
jgi:type II secretory pathway pseudopilin PulG